MLTRASCGCKKEVRSDDAVLQTAAGVENPDDAPTTYLQAFELRAYIPRTNLATDLRAHISRTNLVVEEGRAQIALQLTIASQAELSATKHSVYRHLAIRSSLRGRCHENDHAGMRPDKTPGSHVACRGVGWEGQCLATSMITCHVPYANTECAAGVDSPVRNGLSTLFAVVVRACAFSAVEFHHLSQIAGGRQRRSAVPLTPVNMKNSCPSEFAGQSIVHTFQRQGG